MAPSTEITIASLAVHGTLPAGLSGQLVGIGSDGLIHSVSLLAGGAAYRCRGVMPAGVKASSVVAFGGSILAVIEGSLAFELNWELDTLRRVDLAGQARGLSAYPKLDPFTGALHLLAVAATGAQAHVVVSAGGLTRSSRPIIGAPNLLTDLAITPDRVVFVSDGFVGVASRHGEAHVTWIATEAAAPRLVHADDAGDTVVLYTVTSALECWTLRPNTATFQRETIDPTSRLFARLSGDFVAADGWLVGLAHDPSSDETDFVVFDDADLAGSAIATVRIPRSIPRGIHSTWIPSPHQNPKPKTTNKEKANEHNNQ